MKYTNDLKIKIVREYLEGNYSLSSLMKNYNISSKELIRRWVETVKQNGYQSLTKTSHNVYSLDFKLEVIKYYMSHKLGLAKVAAKYNVNYSQVYSWYRIYKNEGIVGLRPKPKGRPSKYINMPKRKTNRITPTKEEQYKQKIADLEAKVAYQNMELDILKKLHALRQPQNAKKLK